VRERQRQKNRRAGRTGQHDMYATKLKRVGGIGGIAREPQKNEHMSEIQLNPQGGRDKTRYTIIERAINTRRGGKEKQVIDRYKKLGRRGEGLPIYEVEMAHGWSGASIWPSHFHPCAWWNIRSPPAMSFHMAGRSNSCVSSGFAFEI
jgi:hypothetical protein